VDGFNEVGITEGEVLKESNSKYDFFAALSGIFIVLRDIFGYTEYNNK